MDQMRKGGTERLAELVACKMTGGGSTTWNIDGTMLIRYFWQSVRLEIVVELGVVCFNDQTKNNSRFSFVSGVCFCKITFLDSSIKMQDRFTNIMLTTHFLSYAYNDSLMEIMTGPRVVTWNEQNNLKLSQFVPSDKYLL